MAISLVRLAIVAVVSGTLWSLRRQARERRSAREHLMPPAPPEADDAAGRLAGGPSRPPEPDPATLTLP